ncbi:MAG: exonuclease SbcCD subunit D C-terminal domain-containing protein [Colwellia sp.]
MRIIHTSDWHLGQYFYGKSRADEHQQFLTWLLAQVTRHKIDAIIVAGDIFDTSTPPSYAREMYFSFIAQLQGKNCQLIILAGNHDSVAMLSESQTVLKSLSTRVITHVTPEYTYDIASQRGKADDKNNPKANISALVKGSLKQQVFPLYNCDGDVSAMICAIPFVRPRDVIKSRAGQSASDKQQSLQQAISDHYQYLYQHALSQAKEYERQQGSAVPIIATGHLTALGVSINDSQSDAVRDIYIGSLEAFPASAFPPADYIALGHIHRAQKIAKSEHIRYCGSPIPLSFDEAKQDKRVLMVEFTSGKFDKVEDLIIPCFQPLYMVKTSVDELEPSLQAALALFEQYQAENKPRSEIKAWLDIEIDNADHLSDLSQRVSELTQEMPVEVLLVRRSKQARQRQQAQLSQQNNSMLSELSLVEVFDSRLSQLEWKTEDELARKVRLQALFTEISVELSLEGKQAKSSVEPDTDTGKVSDSARKQHNSKLKDIEQQDL